MADSKQTIQAIERRFVAFAQAKQAALLSGARALTPVDTGRAQAGWISAQIIRKPGDTGIVENTVPYIGWLEFGSDTVAPQAMVRNTIAQLKGK